MSCSSVAYASIFSEFSSHFLISDFFPSLVHRVSSSSLALVHTQIRSIYWRCFLGLLSVDSTSTWASQLSVHRAKFSSLYQRHFPTEAAHSDTSAPSFDHPLAPVLRSPRSSLRDSPIRTIIDLDLSRTHPDDPFFERPDIRQEMSEVLLIWAAENAEYEYRQGFNEILALVTKLLHSEYCLSQDTPGSDPLLTALLDSSAIQADSYLLFSSILSVISPLFARVDIRKSSALRDSLVDRSSDPTENTPIVKRCNYIHFSLLKERDFALFRHLQSHEVSPQIYLLRWLRLLFAREFPIEEVFLIWDLIFAHAKRPLGPDSFQSADEIALSMVDAIRGVLMSGENSECLTALMKYPIQKTDEIRDAAAERIKKNKQGHKTAQPQPLQSVFARAASHFLSPSPVPPPQPISAAQLDDHNHTADPLAAGKSKSSSSSSSIFSDGLKSLNSFMKSRNKPNSKTGSKERSEQGNNRDKALVIKLESVIERLSEQARSIESGRSNEIESLTAMVAAVAELKQIREALNGELAPEEFLIRDAPEHAESVSGSAAHPNGGASVRPATRSAAILSELLGSEENQSKSRTQFDDEDDQDDKQNLFEK